MGAICHRYSYRSPIGHVNGCLFPSLIQTFELMKAIPIDAKGNKRQGGHVDILFFRLGIGHLLHETISGKMIGGTAGQEQWSQ